MNSFIFKEPISNVFAEAFVVSSQQNNVLAGFDNLTDALTFINTDLTLSATNRALIKISPGIYTINNSISPITIPSFVSLSGKTKEITRLTASVATNDLFHLESSTELENLLLDGTNSASLIDSIGDGDFCYLNNLEFSNSSVSINVSGTTTIEANNLLATNSNNNFVTSSTGTHNIQNCIIDSVTNGFIATGGTLNIKNISISNSSNALTANGGTIIANGILGNTNNKTIVTNNSGTFTGISVLATNTVTAEIEQNNTNDVIKLIRSFGDFDLTTIVNNTNIYLEVFDESTNNIRSNQDFEAFNDRSLMRYHFMMS